MAIWEDVPFDVKDLISKMLNKDPKKRITIEEVLKHSCFKSVHREVNKIELEESEMMSLKTYASLSEFSKKLMRFCTRYIDTESKMALKERFIVLDSQNLGSIPIITKKTPNFSSTKNMLSRVRLNSDGMTTRDTLGASRTMTHKIGGPIRFRYGDYIAAMVNPDMLCNETMASVIFDTFKLKQNNSKISGKVKRKNSEG